MPQITAPKVVPLKKARLAELALAIGSFAIGTGEFAAMGFLPSVADGLDVSIPEAGESISAYALGVVVGAPLIAVLGAKLPRRALLLILMSVFAVANLASAMAPNFLALLALRFASGLPHGAYFGVAALVAAGMAGPNGRTRAVGRVMLGLTIATLIGAPVATWAGQTLGWRTGFAFVGTLALVTFGLVALCVPRDKPRRGAGPLRELGALKEPQVWLTLGVAAIGFGGMFAVFSYNHADADPRCGPSGAGGPVRALRFWRGHGRRQYRRSASRGPLAPADNRVAAGVERRRARHLFDRSP